MWIATVTCALLLTSSNAAPAPDAKRAGLNDLTTRRGLIVDLGYAVYQGVENTTTGVSTWRGIRYAAPPIGSLRWKAPQTPATNRTTTLASTFGPICPQAFPAVPNAPFIPGNEDCLFLNVYKPTAAVASSLPVLVWIHGGGYGAGDATQDMTEIINANNNGFVAVSIQYRLGAFGFLSSNEVKAKAVLNAGLLDQAFALKWVQTYIHRFGGNPNKVTISGESAGAGSVMLHAMAKGGTLGTALFQNGIAASPYLPSQYRFDAAIPTQRYYDLATKVGCGSSGAVFDCLVSKDSLTLQYANSNITTSGTFATWAYLPVTDGFYIRSLPSAQLNARKVNGKSILVGNNANEGALFVPQNITTLNDLKLWLGLQFPTFNDAQVQQVFDAYPSTDAPVNANSLKFETNGYGPATAVNVSQVATGQQQRAFNIYAEVTFICPSYWLNNAYTSSYHYQYSVPFASHGDDVAGYFGPTTLNQSPSFSLAFRRIWGNFIKTSDPSIPSEAAAANWPEWVADQTAKMLNLNVTGGTPYQAIRFGATVTQFMEPGLKNNFTIAPAYSWEGGRGKRCDFWKSIATQVPM